MLKNVKLLREEYGISQVKLAEIIGMSQQSVNGYENHDVEPDIATLIKIADYFNTSIDFIVGNTTIRRKIEAVSEFSLNEQEAEHIRKYRKLRDSTKINIDDLLDDILAK